MEKKVSAFNDKLVVSEHNERDESSYGEPLYRLEHDDRFVIRKVEQQLLPDGLSKTASETARDIGGLFEELKERFHIPVSAQVVVAEDNGLPATFVLTETVVPFDLDAATAEEMRRAGEEMLTTLDSLLAYLEQKSESEERFLADIFDRSQYVYGSQASDATPHWHLVDTDPFYTNSARRLTGCADELRAHAEYLRDTFSTDVAAFMHRLDSFSQRLATGDV